MEQHVKRCARQIVYVSQQNSIQYLYTCTSVHMYNMINIIVVMAIITAIVLVVIVCIIFLMPVYIQPGEPLGKLDAILYINLEHRTDRKEKVLKELAVVDHICSNVIRIDAVKDSDNGARGCTQSHIKALDKAIANGWDSVMIVEDDFKWRKQWKAPHQLQRILDAPVHVDVFMLFSITPLTLTTCFPWMRKVVSANSTSGYIVRKSYFNTLRESFKKSAARLSKKYRWTNELLWGIDTYWFRLQWRDTFVLSPISTQVSLFESDIR